jgi:hypothetical protein
MAVEKYFGLDAPHLNDSGHLSEPPSLLGNTLVGVVLDLTRVVKPLNVLNVVLPDHLEPESATRIKLRIPAL